MRVIGKITHYVFIYIYVYVYTCTSGNRQRTTAACYEKSSRHDTHTWTSPKEKLLCMEREYTTHKTMSHIQWQPISQSPFTQLRMSLFDLPRNKPIGPPTKHYSQTDHIISPHQRPDVSPTAPEHAWVKPCHHQKHGTHPHTISAPELTHTARPHVAHPDAPPAGVSPISV